MVFYLGFMYGILLVMWVILLIVYFKLLKKVDNLSDDLLDTIEDTIDLETRCNDNLNKLNQLDTIVNNSSCNSSRDQGEYNGN